MDKSYELIKRTCRKCEKEYETKALFIGGGNPIVLSDYCADCGEIILREEEEREMKARELEIQNLREQWRKTCGIPPKFQADRFETFKPARTASLRRAYEDCFDYAEKFIPGAPQGYRSMILYSVGVWGVGKSHLAASIAHKVLDNWTGQHKVMPVRYISEPQLFLRIRSTFNRNPENHSETESDIYRELTTIPLLIIDDMGKEEVSDPRFVQRVLFAIVNGRYENMLPMVITANLDYNALHRHLGGDRNNEASFNRLIEMTQNKLREIQATTYRDFSNR